MKVQSMMLSTCLVVGLALSSCDKDNEKQKLNDTDQDFMKKASISNTAEVSAGTLAATKATNARVKAFAQHMIMEHTTAQNDLKNVGNKVGYPVKDTIDPEHVAIAALLNTLSGRAFDSAYIHSQVADHDKTIGFFQNEINNGRHMDVKNYASSKLPNIQMHRTQADSIAKAFFMKR
jgi:putative membrane protein